MANRIVTMLSNTKTRTMVLLVAGILIIGVTFAVSQAGSKGEDSTPDRQSRTTEVPNQVKSTPGAEVTRKYQELQEQANIRGAQEAAKKGTTFIPTLTGNVQGYTDADFEKQLTSAYDTLGGKCSKEKVAELTKQGMKTTEIIMQLKQFGCSAEAIAALFTPDQIAAALLAEKGCAPDTNDCSAETVKQLKLQGNDTTKIVAKLKENGCNINQIAASLKEAGSSVDEITMALKANGSDAVEIATALAKAGFAKNEVMAALTKAGFSAVDVAKALNALNLAEANNPALLAQQQAQNAAAQRLSAQQEAQQLAAYSQQRQGKIQELVTAMENQRKQAMEVWAQVPQQLFTQGEWASKKAQAEQAAANGDIGGKNGNKDAGKVILKAGSILFGVLDTAVNSDEPGPVMATIVAGSLKGAKLLGSISTNTDSETITLNFTAINMPNEANSMGISAVAIDPDTARTALASDVDHHYLYRWGSLFASSFVQGYASAVASSGTTSTTTQGAAGVSTTTSSPATDAKQQLFSGIAAMGTKWSQVVGQNFDRPITITIDQGTSLGILITSDLTYGTNPVFYTPPTTSTASASTPSSTTGTPTAGPAGLTNDQRQALLNLLQNQPAAAPGPTQQLQPGSSVYTTTGATQ